MTDQEISTRLRRVKAALSDASGLQPEALQPTVSSKGDRLLISQDWSGGRSPEHMLTDAFSVVNEIMGLRDRAKAWMKVAGKDDRDVDRFIKSEPAVALVHDLANSDKHGALDRPPFSGIKPRLQNVTRGAVLKRDPTSGLYMSQGSVMMRFDVSTGAAEMMPSDNVEIVLTGEIVDEQSNRVAYLHTTVEDAITKWEGFLISEGVSLS